MMISFEMLAIERRAAWLMIYSSEARSSLLRRRMLFLGARDVTYLMTRSQPRVSIPERRFARCFLLRRQPPFSSSRAIIS